MVQTFDVKNPATGAVIGTLKINTKEEVQAAIESCHEGFKEWQKTDAHHRSGIITVSYTHLTLPTILLV